MLVPKKADASGERKFRLVVDYWKLNEKTVGNAYPLLDITEILDQLGQAKYFSCLDLAMGYHQIEMNPEDIDKTAFSMYKGGPLSLQTDAVWVKDGTSHVSTRNEHGVKWSDGY